MTKKLFLLFFILTARLFLFAQSGDPVVVKINNEPVLKSELSSAFQKSNKNKPIDGKESIDEFVQSFINLKLNVAEAKAQQLDASDEYKRQYSSYKLQIANSYLRDTTILNTFVNKYYKRMQEDLDINHAWVAFDKKDMLPADTLSFYQRALSLRAELMKNNFKGTGFTDNANSPSMVMDITSLNGHLGWIASLKLPPQIEEVAYELPLNEISMPIRTSKGYHLIQIIGRRPAAGGVYVDQVMFSFPQVPPSQHLIDSVGSVARSVYEHVKSDADFQILCGQYAKAHDTGDKGCAFGIVNLNTTIAPTFINAALSLKNEGDISPLIMTDYGFHILQLKQKFPIPPLSTIKESLIKVITKANRRKWYEKELIRQMAAKYNLSVKTEVVDKLFSKANNVSVLDLAFAGRITDKDKDNVLFSIDGKKNYTVGDFARYLKNTLEGEKNDPDKLPDIYSAENISYNIQSDKLRDIFATYIYNSLYLYAESVLENSNPEFAQIMNEYADGLLFFEVMNRNVWNKAQTDNAGLEAYFNKHKAAYKWETPRYKGVVLHCANEAVQKEAEAIAGKYKNADDIIGAIRESLNKNTTTVIVEKGTWVKGENRYVDNKVFEGQEVAGRNNFPFFVVVGRFISSPEDYNDVRGEVEAGYQEQLEAQWMANLRKKYKVDINKSVLKSIE